MIDDPIVATLARGQLYELTVALYSWAKSAQGCGRFIKDRIIKCGDSSVTTSVLTYREYSNDRPGPLVINGTKTLIQSCWRFR